MDRLEHESKYPGFELSFNVVGVTFQNSEGVNIQSIIPKVKREDDITLIHEWDNPYDSNAVAVIHKLGRVGYVPKETAAKIAHYLDAGRTPIAFVTDVIGGSEGYNWGLDVWMGISNS